MLLLTSLLLGSALAVNAAPNRLGRTNDVEERGLPQNLAVAACSAQLRLQGQAGAVCTSFVGGVKTKTVVASAQATTQVTDTITETTSVSGPTQTITYAVPTETTITLPPTSTATWFLSDVTTSYTVTGEARSAGDACGAAITAQAKRGLPIVDKLIGLYPAAVISSACSRYFITTPTVTSTSTSTSTLTAFSTTISRITGDTVTESVPTPTVYTRTEYLPDGIETSIAFSTVTQAVATCRALSGLQCVEGSCRCTNGGDTSCGGICGARVICAQYQFPRSGGFGLTSRGIADNGSLYCKYGFGNMNGAAIYCEYDLGTGVNTATLATGGRTCPATVTC